MNRREGKAVVLGRWRVVLAVSLATFLPLVVLLLGFFFAPPNPYREQFSRIRKGMTKEEVVGIMGRQPDFWNRLDTRRIPFGGSRRDWPPPPEATVEMYWANPDGSAVTVGAASAGAEVIIFSTPPAEPFWTRLRRWLRL